MAVVVVHLVADAYVGAHMGSISLGVLRHDFPPIVHVGCVLGRGWRVQGCNCCFDDCLEGWVSPLPVPEIYNIDCKFVMIGQTL